MAVGIYSCICPLVRQLILKMLGPGGASAAMMFQHFNCASQVLPSQQSLRQPFCGPAMNTSPALGGHAANETVGSAV